MGNVQGKFYYKPRDNAYILNAVRKNASNTYQQRIPAVDKGNIQQTLQTLLDNLPLWNEFHSALVNRVGKEIFRFNNWNNPLGIFKQGMLTHGDTVQEVAVGLAQAYTYDADRNYLEDAIFGQERADVRAAYHKINLQRYYKVTLNRDILRRAFNDDFALSDHIQQVIGSLSNSDELDEFAAMIGVLKEFYLAGGFFKQNVPNVSAQGSTAADAKAMLRRAREFADKFTFLSPHYNALGMPVHADRSKLVLITTPEAKSGLDVEALAVLFNVERADVPGRIIVVPDYDVDIPGFQGIVTTEDFWVVLDSLYETREVDNPVGLYTNHLLHHHQVISVSPFVPAVLLWTGESDEINVPRTPVTDIEPLSVLDSTGANVSTVLRGGVYNVSGQAVTTPDGGFNDAVRLELIGANSPRTYVVRSSLYVAWDEDALSLTLRATATDDNSITEDKVLDVDGEYVAWLPPVYLPDADSDGDPEVTPDAPEFDAETNTISIPSTNAQFVTYRDGATNLTPGQELVISADKTITVVAKTGYELAAGATASWTFDYEA